MGAPLLALAGLALTLGALAAVRSGRLLRHGVRARATVVEVDAAGEASFPVVAFADPAGRPQQARLPFCGARPAGTVVDVVYPRGRPGRAREVSFGGLWALPLVLIALGCLALAFGAGVSGGGGGDRPPGVGRQGHRDGRAAGRQRRPYASAVTEGRCTLTAGLGRAQAKAEEPPRA